MRLAMETQDVAHEADWKREWWIHCIHHSIIYPWREEGQRRGLNKTSHATCTSLLWNRCCNHIHQCCSGAWGRLFMSEHALESGRHGWSRRRMEGHVGKPMATFSLHFVVSSVKRGSAEGSTPLLMKWIPQNPDLRRNLFWGTHLGVPAKKTLAVPLISHQDQVALRE